MGIQLNDYEMKSINRVLDPEDTGKFKVADILKDSNMMN